MTFKYVLHLKLDRKFLNMKILYIISPCSIICIYMEFDSHNNWIDNPQICAQIFRPPLSTWTIEQIFFLFQKNQLTWFSGS